VNLDPPPERAPAELRAFMESIWRRPGVMDSSRPQRWTTRHLHATKNIAGHLIEPPDATAL
jgi:hypothetical protein